ncbi:MAG: hypothetical protein MJ007_05955 [Paludibacteraceae bacterium]|nr:hypothetical protein [Paludibacteraceae bacterium]
MYRHDAEKPLLSVVTAIVITAVTAIAMWTPVILDNYNIELKILAPLFFIVSALIVIWSCYTSNTIKGNLVTPALFITLCCGTLGYTDGWYKGFICCILVLVSYLITLNFYKSKDTVWRVFDVMLILSASFFVDQSVIWIIPAFIIGFGIFDALNVRNLVACLFGLGLPFGVVAAYYYFCDDICMFQHYITDITINPIFTNLRIADAIVYGCIGVYTLCALVAYALNYQKQSIQFRSSVLFTFIIILLSTLMEEPLTLILVSIPLSIYVERSKSTFHKILFYTFLTTMILIFLFKTVVI